MAEFRDIDKLGGLFVDSGATNASDGNVGDSPERPLATIEGGDWAARRRARAVTALGGLERGV